MLKESYEAQVLEEEEKAFEAYKRAEAESERKLQIAAEEEIEEFFSDDAVEDEPSDFDPKNKGRHAAVRKNDIKYRKKRANSGEKPWKRRKPWEHRNLCYDSVCAFKARVKEINKEMKREIDYFISTK